MEQTGIMNGPAERVLSLEGRWEIAQAGGADAPFPGKVPGTVHEALLEAGRIEDPFHGENEIATEWVSRAAWVWSREFNVPAELLEEERVVLCCAGLDTLATVRVNGRELGVTNNMFRSWEFDLKGVLKAGSNSIEVEFASALETGEALYAERHLPCWGIGPGGDKFSGGAYLRKAQCHFGWDWGPKLPTCGIWRAIEVRATSGPRLVDVAIEQHHNDGAVELDVKVAVEEGSAPGMRLAVLLEKDGQELSRQEFALNATEGTCRITVPRPELWWPNGLGGQPLYEVIVRLYREGVEAARATKRIGLRTLRLARKKDQWGESFHFEVNGHPFFAKGANWIPGDPFVTRMTTADYERLIGDAARANMNMLRVWGGGIYEQDAFYELCDRHGITVWQDFMFACSTYPTYDAAWMENVRAEAEENVRRLRHHACLAFWCGNNELEQGLVADQWNETAMSWEDYLKLFDQLLADVVARIDPQRDYWPASPHTPVGDRKDFNNPTNGDAHLWAVWHGRQPFEWYRTSEHRFCSEFGFQSFPEPRTVAVYTPPEQRNITSPIMEHHQRSGIGNTTIIHYLLSWYRMPKGFEGTLWLSQVLQAMAMKYAVEHWRRNMPRTMGALYWQLNDCWPVASWSSIDSLGRWKALQYRARRFFAPQLISIVEDPATHSMTIHVTNDGRDGFDAVIRACLYSTDGRVIREERLEAFFAANCNTVAATIDLSEEVKREGERQLLFVAELIIGGEAVSSNLAHFVRPKHLSLHDPEVRADVVVESGAPTLVLHCKRPALNVVLALEEGEAVLSDNFFDLMPGERKRVTVLRCSGGLPAEILRRLRVSTLYDTFN